MSPMLFTAMQLLEAANPFDKMANPIITLIDMAVGPAIGIVGALGAIYCIMLGAKIAKAEEPQDQMKAKLALKNALIGFVLIFVLLVALKLGVTAMSGWVNSNVSGTIVTTAAAGK